MSRSMAQIRKRPQCYEISTSACNNIYPESTTVNFSSPWSLRSVLRIRIWIRIILGSRIRIRSRVKSWIRTRIEVKSRSAGSASKFIFRVLKWTHGGSPSSRRGSKQWRGGSQWRSGGSQWSLGGFEGQLLQICITFYENRVRIRIKVKSRNRIRTKVKRTLIIWLRTFGGSYPLYRVRTIN